MSRTNRTLLGDVIKIGIVRLCAFAVISLSSLFGFATQAGAQGIFNGTWSGTSVWIPPAGPQTPFPISFSLTFYSDHSINGIMGYYYSGLVTGTWTGANPTSATIELQGSVYGGPDIVMGNLTNRGTELSGQWKVVNNGSGFSSVANFSASGGGVGFCDSGATISNVTLPPVSVIPKISVKPWEIMYASLTLNFAVTQSAESCDAQSNTGSLGVFFNFLGSSAHVANSVTAHNYRSFNRGWLRRLKPANLPFSHF